MTVSVPLVTKTEVESTIDIASTRTCANDEVKALWRILASTAPFLKEKLAPLTRAGVSVTTTLKQLII